MALSFEELRLRRAHRDSIKRVQAGEFEEVRKAEWEQRCRERALGVVGLGHVVQSDERTMLKRAKQGKRLVQPKGSSGPVTSIKFDADGNPVSTEFITDWTPKKWPRGV